MKIEMQKITGKDSSNTEFAVWARLQVAESIEEATTLPDYEVKLFEDEKGKNPIYGDYNKKQSALTTEFAKNWVCSKYSTNTYDKIRAFVKAKEDAKIAEQLKAVAAIDGEKKAKLIKAGFTAEEIDAMIAVAKSVK